METPVDYLTARQFDLFGGLAYPPLTDAQRVAVILEQHPEARNDDGLLIYLYWMEFDGLGAVLRDEETRARFLAFLRDDTKTSAETIRRRRQEHQLNSTPGAGSLLPTPDQAEYRRRRAHAGPPRRRR